MAAVDSFIKPAVSIPAFSNAFLITFRLYDDKPIGIETIGFFIFFP